MPLSFPTTNRGEVAFGFFNIASDMLLLERHFFFANEFCREVTGVASAEPVAAFERWFTVWTIEDPVKVGDLMSAIRGVSFTGFIGATYRRFPFPERQEDFRQNPEGDATQLELREMIRPFAIEEDIAMAGEPPAAASIGDYRFTHDAFQALVRYVWRGGWPKWRDGVRPGYVTAMADAVAKTDHWLFEGLSLEEE